MDKRELKQLSKNGLVRLVFSLQERLEALERLMARGLKNSSTSSKPPSSDIVKAGQLMRNHEARGLPVQLFVRKAAKVSGKTSPFVYCGQLTFVDWEGEKPITVEWKLEPSLSDRLVRVFDLPSSSA